MMSQQPSGRFSTDAELGDSFSAFAEAVDAAIPAFSGEQADTLSEYQAAVTAYAADPSSPEANARMADMTGPMSEFTGWVAARCGLDVVNDVP